jgi:ribosomal protein S18 acetylase RimI-like enzyme
MTMRSTTTSSSSFAGDSSNDSFVDDTDCYTIEIRRCLYGDLNEAVDVIMKSYYANMKNPWLQMYRLGELNRLQQNFPRMDVNLHCMFVAIATTTNNDNNAADDNVINDGEKRRIIIGFCDVDGRIPNQNTGYIYNPRPYVADMCVDPAFRRRGIGQQLIRACEDFSRNVIQKSHVYLRVERKNKAGVQLYTGMGYQQVDNDDDDDIDKNDARGDYENGSTASKIMLLRKQLDDEAEESTNVAIQSNIRTKRDY